MSNFNDDSLLNGQYALQKVDDLIGKLDDVVSRWPRLHRNTYGERLYKLLAEMEELLIAAHKKFFKKTTLQEIDIKNFQVRIIIRRIAKTTYTDKRGEKRKLITPGQHEEWVKLNLEVGAIVGAWIQKAKETEKTKH